MTGDEIEKKWKVIRGEYPLEKKKIEASLTSGCGTSEVKKAKWFAYDHLAFLKNSFSTEPTFTTESVQEQVKDSEDIFLENDSLSETQLTLKETEHNVMVEENENTETKEPYSTSW